MNRLLAAGAIALLLGCGACAHDDITHAVVVAPTPIATNAAETPDESTRKWLITPEHTRFEVRADAPLAGEQRYKFSRYRAHVTTQGLDAKFHATIDVHSLDGPFGSIVRDRLLAAALYPEATFDGVAHREPRSTGCNVEGNLTVRGITKRLTFPGNVWEKDGNLHFRALFQIPRLEFEIAFGDSWDAFLPNDVTILLDIDAHPETVEAEPL